ncbi:ROK family transcriptional regulator [Dactylosporangium sp. NBC_01737]|uniref:ROK family transcriptional regulator n=1 Tax=Dactylosporangium sp. NBC_01737 TaxID=2975959 RepID=UPI002E0D6D08|nr:ROK family transcriptional regulator [Dactylosporangium sp. NBC_01737]
MQSTTRRTVLELVHRGRARTRRDLSRLIGLSRSAVAQTVAELVAEGLLSEHVTDREERRGRPSTQLRLVPHPGWVGAIDLGHRHVAVALGGMHHNVVDEERVAWRVDRSAQEALALAQTMLADAVGRHAGRRSDLRALGVSVPFPVVDSTVQPIGSVPGWDGVRPGDLLGLPNAIAVIVDNSSDLAAWGEFVQVADPGVRSLIYVSAGDGVGGGLVINGQIFSGTHGISGEIGHVPVPGCRLRCRCGRTGCLDALVSAAGAGDTSSVRAAGRAVGTVLAQVSSFVDPDLVVLGGALGGCDPGFVDSVSDSYLRHEPSRRVAFTAARLGLRSPLWGAFDRATQEAWAGAFQLSPESRNRRLRATALPA